MKRRGGPPEPSPNRTEASQKAWFLTILARIEQNGLTWVSVSRDLDEVVGSGPGRTALRARDAKRAQDLDELTGDAVYDHVQIHELAGTRSCAGLGECPGIVIQLPRGIPRALVARVMNAHATYRRLLDMWVSVERDPAVSRQQDPDYGRLIRRLHERADLSFKAIALIVEMHRGKRLPLSEEAFRSAVESVRAAYYAEERKPGAPVKKVIRKASK